MMPSSVRSEAYWKKRSSEGEIAEKYCHLLHSFKVNGFLLHKIPYINFLIHILGHERKRERLGQVLSVFAAVGQTQTHTHNIIFIQSDWKRSSKLGSLAFRGRRRMKEGRKERKRIKEIRRGDNYFSHSCSQRMAFEIYPKAALMSS